MIKQKIRVRASYDPVKNRMHYYYPKHGELQFVGYSAVQHGRFFLSTSLVEFCMDHGLTKK